MKDRIISVNLETETSPIIQEVRGTEYIEYGTENWKNLYPQFLIDLYYNSSTHAAIINATAEMIAGEALHIDDADTNLDAYVKLKKFFRHANGKETLHQIIKKIAFDFKLQGAYAIHIIWNQERTEIAEIYHVPVERVRAGVPNDLGQVDTYYISSDWKNVRENPPSPIVAFNTKDRTEASQLLYTGSYSPNMDIYHTPDYLAGCNWALVDQRVAEFHLNNIENGFSGSYFISFANGIPTQEERMQIEQSLTDKFTGASNSGKFILTFSDDKTRTPEIHPITQSDADKQYLALQELLTTNILTAHRVTSKTLMGIDSASGFSSNADELNAASNFYTNSVVRPFQINLLDTLQKIFSVNNMDLEVSFVQLKPITLQFTNQDLAGVMTQDEIREELGLAPLVTAEKNETTDALSTMSPLLANKVLNNLTLDETRDLIGLPSIDPAELPQTEEVAMCRQKDPIPRKKKFKKAGMIDGKPVFDTIEEAEAHSKTLGCTGYHEHEYEGRTVYMACEGHDEAIELKQFIAEFGEDKPEGYELFNEEVVDGEHSDFDFEDELNKIANQKLEFASTPRATPNARDDQDGLNEDDTAFYKVRYVYARDNFIPNWSGTSRDFCKDMMSADKIYRKRDIVRANSNSVNPGFGHKGRKYNLFFYKGGPNCLHYWKRQIYRSKDLKDADYVYYPDDLSDDKLVSYAKAKSEGFTAERNDGLVATAPANMKNNGYYN